MERIWLKSYPANVPSDINPDSCQSIPELFTQSCATFSNLPAYTNLGVTLTYQDVADYTRHFACYLQQVLGCRKGDRLAIILPNILQYPIVLLGALQAGLIVVNVNPLYTPPELIHQLNDSGAETVVFLANFGHVLAQALPQTRVKNLIVAQIGDFFPRVKASVVHFYLRYIKGQILPFNLPLAVPFKKAIQMGRSKVLQPVLIQPQDVAFLQYTGGTTGLAKGAMLTHRNLLANIIQAETWFKDYLKNGQEVVITALPLYHIFSLTANCLYFIKLGALNVLITDPRNFKHFLSVLRKVKFTVFTGVNTLFNALMQQPAFPQLDFSHLKVCLGGGTAVQRPVAEKWQTLTGTPLIEAYGLTEASPCVTLNPATLSRYNGSVGLPVSSTEVAILSESGELLPIGSVGELGVKGPQVMLGYWQASAETQKAFNQGGWLLTGDMASMDENGFLRILERKKDMILVSGFNVYPTEIETALLSLPAISEAAVIGVPDEYSGEAVKAFIVKKDLALTAEDVIAYCRNCLAGYKIPKQIEFCKELPKSNVGKILRRALRQTVPPTL